MLETPAGEVQCGDRRQRSGPVGARGRPPGRRRHPARLAPAPLRRHRAGAGGRRRSIASCRCCATRTPRTTCGRRAAVCWSVRSSATRSRGRSTACRRTSTGSCCRRTSIRSRNRSPPPPSGCRRSAAPGIKSVVNGPDAYTPDGHCLMGPVPGLHRLPRPRRLQHLRDRLRRRRRPVRGGMDRRGPAERQHVGARRAPLRRLRAPRSRTSSPGPDRSTSVSMRSATRRRSCRRGGRSRPIRSTSGSPAAAPSSASASAGSARSGSRRTARRPATSTRSGAATGSTPSARSAAPSARASESSTRRASASTWSRARAPRRFSTAFSRTCCPWSPAGWRSRRPAVRGAASSAI